VKVLFLNPIGELGGAERSLLDLIRSLRSTGERIEITVATFAPGPLLDAARDLGCKALVVPLPTALTRIGDSRAGPGLGLLRSFRAGLGALVFGPGFTFRLRRTIAAENPDVVHTNGFKAHVLGAVVRPKRASLVWHLRDFVGSRPIVGRLLPRLARRADLAIAISNSVATDARALLSVPVATLLNAVDTAYFAPRAVTAMDLDMAASLPPPSEFVTRVGLVATYAWWKGHEVFLRAAERLKNFPIRFYLVGGPVYETPGSQRSASELRSLICRLRLTNSAGLIPFQNDPRAAYLALDVVVHASIVPEPFGRTIAEAMACGRAVIASSAGGPAEQIEDRRTGLLVPPNDEVALAEAIHLLHNTPELRQSLGASARAFASSALDAQRLGPTVLSWYRETAKRREPLLNATATRRH